MGYWHQKRSKRLWAMGVHCATRARRKKRGLLTSALCVCVCSFSNEPTKYNTLKDARNAVFPRIFPPLLYIAVFIMPAKVVQSFEIAKEKRKKCWECHETVVFAYFSVC